MFEQTPQNIKWEKIHIFIIRKIIIYYYGCNVKCTMCIDVPLNERSLFATTRKKSNVLPLADTIYFY